MVEGGTFAPQKIQVGVWQGSVLAPTLLQSVYERYHPNPRGQPSPLCRW